MMVVGTSSSSSSSSSFSSSVSVSVSSLTLGRLLLLAGLRRIGAMLTGLAR